MDYTFHSLAGFIMKVFVLVFMLKILFNGIQAVLNDTHLGAGGNPFSSSTTKDDGGHQQYNAPAKDLERGGWNTRKANNMYESPDNTPATRGRDSISPARPNRGESPSPIGRIGNIGGASP